MSPGNAEEHQRLIPLRLDMASIDDFAAIATEFTEWCAARPGSADKEARTALKLLLQLCSAAIDLDCSDSNDDDTDTEPEATENDDAAWRQVYERASCLPIDCYSLIFDPLTVPPEQPVVGSLSDDIADIWRDLSNGLLHYREGRVAEAEWQFAFSFQVHWGHHATGAIGALTNWFRANGS